MMGERRRRRRSTKEEVDKVTESCDSLSIND